MMNKSILVIVLILILLGGYLMGYQVSKSNQYHDTKNLLEDQRVLVNTIKNFVKYGNLDVEDIEVVDVHNEKKKLSSFLDKEKMIIYIPKLDCMSCAERELEVLNQTIGNEYRSNIFIISNFDNIREQRIFEQASGIKCLRRIDNSIFPSFLLSDVSVTFLLDTTMRTSNYLYNFEKESHVDITKIYYLAILERFIDCKR